MPMYRTAVLLTLGLLASAGCTEKSPASDTSTNSTTTGTTDSTTTATSNTTTTTSSTTTTVEAGIALIGVSGNTIILNQLWIQGCIASATGAAWTDSRRVLLTDSEPYRLVTTFTEYNNDSPTPDCQNGLAGNSAFTQEVASLNEQVSFDWVDLAGVPAAAPAGLETVTMANGLEGIMTEATTTADTPERAALLNFIAFCGVTDWQVGTVVDTLLCFNGGYPPQSGKTLLVVDDRVTPWKNYQAAPTSPLAADGYPTQMPNALPFEGPFAP